MFKRLAAIAALVLTLGCLSTPAFAGSPHFVGTPTATIDGDTLTVSGKVAGLGNETQIHVEVTADAACINPGGNDPEAANKESFSAAGDFPVQNGKANFSLSVTANFQPICAPPMNVEWSNPVVTADGLSATL
jgi:hypothetical protein